MTNLIAIGSGYLILENLSQRRFVRCKNDCDCDALELSSPFHRGDNPDFYKNNLRSLNVKSVTILAWTGIMNHQEFNFSCLYFIFKLVRDFSCSH